MVRAIITVLPRYGGRPTCHATPKGNGSLIYLRIFTAPRCTAARPGTLAVGVSIRKTPVLGVAIGMSTARHAKIVLSSSNWALICSVGFSHAVP